MKTPKKPKCCQWMSGVCSLETSTWTQCKNKPAFKVWCEDPHICVGWVCVEHATNVITQRLGQIS